MAINTHPAWKNRKKPFCVSVANAATYATDIDAPKVELAMLHDAAGDDKIIVVRQRTSKSTHTQQHGGLVLEPNMLSVWPIIRNDGSPSRIRIRTGKKSVTLLATAITKDLKTVSLKRRVSVGESIRAAYIDLVSDLAEVSDFAGLQICKLYEAFDGFHKRYAEQLAHL